MKSIRSISLAVTLIICGCSPRIGVQSTSDTSSAADTTVLAPRPVAPRAATPAADSTNALRHPDPQTLSPAQWQGKRFMLLQKIRMFSQYGYHLYATPELDKTGKPLDPAVELPSRRLRYEVFAGCTATVTSVELRRDGEWLVAFAIPARNTNAYGVTTQGVIEGIALLDDLEAARERWLGRTIFAQRRSFDLYDSTISAFTSRKVSLRTPLTVTAVRWGVIPLPPKPIWLLVQSPDSTRGVLPVHYSWTNVLQSKRTMGMPWESDLLEHNPGHDVRWEDLFWEAIDEHRVLTGMTLQQATMAWGQPLEVSQRQENGQEVTTCRFERGTLRFVNDSLAGSQ